MHTLSNLLSSIKNAQKAKKRVLHFSSFKAALISDRKRAACMPVSRLCWDFCRILYNEGYIHGFSQQEGSLRIVLKYYHFSVIKMETISKPGFRIYSKKNRLSKKREGLGITILSTSKGNLICDREAQKTNNFGGEILCQVF
uniref:ribosomal protein S8 n=1 Tax=Pellia epiphylla TaxID=40340 RepID=UPI00257A33AD|nr:ribosomal protein S8 [Pellia epiphylla]WIA66711.1 ribosomal protein S8 [Pellia epiphylla var. borealis]WIA66670.1 ribosomal protein S8 [Pellia epiphylla]WIA66752.1 ribosomal protein S8 [Pellia epiphylla var. borealis]WIA66793.1 ribosomal protein S8 [Pellia epiphylla]WIA66834.1 ribosomal protein S8 [Pellia epiphylla]